jgi:hypothetical protein
MNQSPEIRVDSLREAQDLTPGSSKPAYVAAIFKGSLSRWPGAVIQVMGGQMIANAVEQTLLRLGVRQEKIEIIPLDASKFTTASPWLGGSGMLQPVQGVSLSIVYRPMKRVTIQFKPDAGDPPVDVQFDVSPDGTEVEVGAQVTVLKNYLVKYAGASRADSYGRGRIRTIKIATKVAGLAQFDFGTQNKVVTTLKGKVKEALTIEVAKGLAIEFYGAGFAKYKPSKPEAKLGGEFGVGLTITWD